MKDFMRKLLTLFSVFSLSLIGAVEKHSDEVYIKGEINADFISKLNSVKLGSFVTINSIGGHPAYGELAASIIQDRSLNVYIKHQCLSSCAEYILPAANKIKFIELPIIGFHQNPILINEIYKDNSGSPSQICNYHEHIQPLVDLHASNLGSASFWKEILAKLELQSVKIIPRDGCDEVGMKFLYSIWLPNSNQLNELLQLKFDGHVCADSLKCRVKVRNVFASKGMSVVIE